MRVSGIRLHDVLNYLSSDEGFEFLRGPGQPALQSIHPDAHNMFPTRDEAAMALIHELVPLFTAGETPKQGLSPLELRVDLARSETSSALEGLLREVRDAKAAGKLQKSHRALARMSSAEGEVLAQLAPFEKGYWGADRMPMLALSSARLGGPEALKNVSVASMGHLFWTTPALYEALEANGVAREDHVVGGKGYSKDPVVVAQLLADAWRVDRKLVTEYGYTRESSMEEKRAVAILEQLFEGHDPETSTRKFLLLDDGGYLVTALHENAHLRRFAHLCHAVEQTDSGIDRIRQRVGENNLLCSVENYGRSQFKSDVESPMIGEAVVTETIRNLTECHPDLTMGNSVTIMGFGDVGQATTDALLRQGYLPEQINVYDTDPMMMIEAAARGFRTPDRLEALERATTLFVCAAGPVLKPQDYNQMPDGVIVVNAASGNEPVAMNTLPVRGEDVIAPTPSGRRLRRVSGESCIGDGQTEAFMAQALDAHRRRALPRTATVLGFDENARRALELLEEADFAKRDIRVYVDSADARARAQAAGYTLATTLDEATRHGQILVNQLESVTTSAIEGRMSAAILVQNTRFDDRWPLGREPFATPEFPEIESESNDWRATFRGLTIQTGAGGEASGYRHRVVHNGYGGRALVLRGGFVINMTQGLPPEYVQIILGALLACSLEAVKRTKPGIHDLSDSLDAELRLATAETIGPEAWQEPHFLGLAGKWEPGDQRVDAAVNAPDAVGKR